MSNGRKRRTIRSGAVAAAGIGLVAAPLALMSGTAVAGPTAGGFTDSVTATANAAQGGTGTGSVTISYTGPISSTDVISVDIAPQGTTTASAVGIASTSTTLTPATNGSGPLPGGTFAATEASAPGSGVPNTQINLTDSGVTTGATANTSFALTVPVKASPGSAAQATNYVPQVTFHAGGASAATATGTNQTNAALVTVNNAVSVASRVPVAIPSPNNAKLADITIAEPANTTTTTTASPVTVKLTNATFASTPTVTASDGTTPTVTPATGSASLSFTPASGASPTATYTISNIVANVTAPVGGTFKAGTKVEATVTQPNNPNFPAMTAIVLGVTTALDNTTFAGKNEDTTAADVYNQEIANGAISTQSLVLATDANFPDALSAAYLAKAHNAGILLTPPQAHCRCRPGTRSSPITRPRSTSWVEPSPSTTP